MSGSPVVRAMLEASTNLEINGTSPLAEVDPKSLQLLWDRINDKIYHNLPEEITDDMLLPMCLELRQQRLAHTDRREKSSETRKRNKAEKSTPVAQQVVDTSISVDDLE